MKKKKIIILSVIILIALAATFFVLKDEITGKSTDSENSAGSASSGSMNQPNINYIPLSQDEIEKAARTILSAEFIKDIPEKDPVSLTFFKFENGQRVWQDGFLIGKNQLLQNGDPGVSIIMNSKYISELNGNNLCDIIKKANKNKDLGFKSKYSTATLFIKYMGLLKYRDCFGF